VKTAYNLRESGVTKLLHVFQTKRSKFGDCYDEAIVSLCKDVNINDAKELKHACLSAEQLIETAKNSDIELCDKCLDCLKRDKNN
jgi:hypothetical protein